MRTQIHNQTAADPALARLGLTAEALLTAVKRGYLARTNCTPNHPPLYAPIVAWGETVRVLREQLAPLGWQRQDDRNYARTLHPSGRTAIAVATGNEATGLANEVPMTKSAKGPITQEAVEINRVQAWLPGMEPTVAVAEQDVVAPTTWFLLIHHADDELRAELSLPCAIGADNRVNSWRERILLPAVPLDLETVTISPPFLPDVEVAVRRKA